MKRDRNKFRFTIRAHPTAIKAVAKAIRAQRKLIATKYKRSGQDCIRNITRVEERPRSLVIHIRVTDWKDFSLNAFSDVLVDVFGTMYPDLEKNVSIPYWG